MRKTHIHIVGEANIGFISQIAFFCRALRRLYDRTEPVRVRCFLGGGEFDWTTAAPHIAAYRDDFDIVMAGEDAYAAHGLYAQCDQAFTDVSDDAEVIVFADADTFWLHRIDDLVDDVFRNHSVAGCMAHFPPPDDHAEDYWERQFSEFSVMNPRLSYQYSMLPEKNSPFYVNFGFVVMSATTLRMYKNDYIDIARSIRSVSEYPYFCYQIALTVLIEKFNLSKRLLPMEYNFPNDDRILLYHDILHKNIRVFHYLREERFKRCEIFLNKENFVKFCSQKNENMNYLLLSFMMRELSIGEWID